MWWQSYRTKSGNKVAGNWEVGHCNAKTIGYVDED